MAKNEKSVTVTKRTMSKSDVQQSAEKDVLKAFAREGEFSWCNMSDVAGLTALAVKLDGVATLSDGTVVIAEVWSHQGTARGSQPRKVASDVLKLVYVKSALEKTGKKVRAYMLFACEDACNALGSSAWRGRAARQFGVETRTIDIDHQTKQAIRNAQNNQNFYKAETPEDGQA